MGCRDGVFSDEENCVPTLLNDSLLFMTMYIIGLPVDVHIKDGSVYSGIFCTASMEDNYAIVLKKATMTKKGNREVNIKFGSLVDTLVVQGEDLVQVVAKEVTISENDIFGGKATSGKRNQSSVAKQHANMTRQAGDGLDVNQSDDEEKTEYQEPEIVDPLHFPSLEKTKYKVMPVNVPSHDPFTAKLDDESYEKFDGVLGVSTNLKSILHVNNSISSKPAKDSKLNPEAKVFTPSPYRNVFVIPAVVPSMGYILDPSLMATADGIQPEYDVTGHAGDGIRPVRFESPYHFDAAPAYMNQNSQNVMAGQMGLPVYLPPLAHDAVSAAGLSQVSLPPLLAQYHAQMPKLAKRQDHFKDPHQT